MPVWYRDGACSHNTTSLHPRCGLARVVDARPDPLRFPSGFVLAHRRQPWNATFGLHTTDPMMLHRLEVPLVIPRQRAIRTFDDADPSGYRRADNLRHSTQVAGPAPG